MADQDRTRGQNDDNRRDGRGSDSTPPRGAGNTERRGFNRPNSDRHEKPRREGERTRRDDSQGGRGSGGAPREGYNRDGGERRGFTGGSRDGGERRGSGGAPREGYNRDSGERRGFTGGSRDGGERRGSGGAPREGYNRDGGERRGSGGAPRAGYNRDGGERRGSGGAPRAGYNRDGGERRGSGGAPREGYNRDGGERRGFTGGSRDGGERRGSGGFNRDSSDRRNEGRPARDQRPSYGKPGEGSGAGDRNGSWRDRPTRGTSDRDGRGNDRAQGRGFQGGDSGRPQGNRDSSGYRRDGADAPRNFRESGGRGDRAPERREGPRSATDRGSFRDSSPRRNDFGSRGSDSAGRSGSGAGGYRDGSPGRTGSSYGGDRERRSFGEAGRGGERRSESPRRFEGERSNGPAGEALSRPHNARDLRSANRPDRERSPEIDEDVTGSELDKITRAEIRNLEERSALWVSKHLVMAGRLLDDDPELAFQHALAASRRGGRLAVVREAVGLTAYAAGHYGEALREFRTYRRISGSNDHLPVMADCERGLGRPDRALDLARSDDAVQLDTAGKVELAIVVSGARTDLGQHEAAVAALEIPQLDKNRAFSYSPRLFRAYADALEGVGRTSDAQSWRRQADVAENALGVGAFSDPDIIDLVGDDDEPLLDRQAAVGAIKAVTPEAVGGVNDDGGATDGGATDGEAPNGDAHEDEANGSKTASDRADGDADGEAITAPEPTEDAEPTEQTELAEYGESTERTDGD